jgi:hypothetical protein
MAPVRLIKSAAALAVAILAGYAAGIAIIGFRIARFDALNQAMYDGKLGVEQLRPLRYFALYAGALVLDRYPWEVIADVWLWFATALVLTVVALAGRLLALVAPLRFAPGRLTCAPVPARDELRRAWAATLRSSRSCRLRPGALAAAALGGLVMALIGEAHALARTALFLKPGVIGPALDTPHWGFLGRLDGPGMVLWALVVSAAALIMAARQRFARDPQALRTWCQACGYPRPQACARTPSDKGSPPLPPCTECGHPAAPLAPRRWAGPALLALGFTVLALALTLHIVGPSLFSRLAGVPPRGVDAVVITADAVVLVQRPQEYLWLRLEPSSTADPSEARLHIELRESPGSAHPIRHTTFVTPQWTFTTLELPDGRSLDVNAAQWIADYRIANVALSRGSTSIRAVDPRTAPPDD